jgi:hypothetical protein
MILSDDKLALARQRNQQRMSDRHAMRQQQQQHAV